MKYHIANKKTNQGGFRVIDKKIPLEEVRAPYIQITKWTSRPNISIGENDDFYLYEWTEEQGFNKEITNTIECLNILHGYGYRLVCATDSERTMKYVMEYSNP